MASIIPVDVSRHSIDLFKDLSLQPRERKPGPPERIDGMTVGILTMTNDAPHGGEVHPDGDELLYVVSGRLRVVTESDPDAEVVLQDGQACIIPKGEWHKVSVLEETQLIHITPGPNGDHRPLA
jgi:mannose-6-phosphate isomerase-like protein (cupin superfamily)